MTESNKPDRWTALLETLGIPVPQPPSPPAPPTETPQSTGAGPDPAPAAAAPPAPPPSRKAKPAAKPSGPSAARSPSYWSRIAGVLGLEVPPQEKGLNQPSVDEPAPTPAPPVAATPPAPPARPVSEPTRMFERRAREERARPAVPSPPVSRGEEGAASRIPSQEGGARRAELPRRPAERPSLREPVTKEELPRRRPAEAAELPPLEEDVEVGEEAVLEEEAVRGEEPPREGRSRRRRRRRGRRGPGAGREEAGRPGLRREEAARSRDEDDIEPAGEAADFEEDQEEACETAWELDEGSITEERAADAEGGQERAGEEERRRSRRRRRRKRGGERPAEERAAAGEPRPSREAARAEEGADVDDEHAEAAGEEDEQAAGVPAHKKIPTWEDAVRILIDANMAARASQRDRGYGRGRSGR